MAFDLQQTFSLATAGRYASPRSAAAVLPIVYGDFSAGLNDFFGFWEAPCVDTVNAIYLLAGHEVQTVSAGNALTLIDRDGSAIPASMFTFNPVHDLEGQGVVATATFSGGSVGYLEPITVRMAGMVDASGTLIENHMDVIYDWAVNQAGIDENGFDDTWRERTRSYLAGQGIRAAGVINKNDRVDRIIAAMIGPLASWWRAGGGKLVFKPHTGPGSLLDSDVAAFLTPKSLDESGATVEFQEENLVTRAAVHYAPNPRTGSYDGYDDGSAEAAVDHEARYGRQYLQEFNLDWIRDQASARKVQQIIVGHYKRPVAEVQADLRGYDKLHLEMGDVVAVSTDLLLDEDGLPLRNQFMRVKSIDLDLGPAGRTGLELMDLGAYLSLAELADGSILADGSEIAGADRNRTLFE